MSRGIRPRGFWRGGGRSSCEGVSRTDRIQIELLYQYQHNVELYPQWPALLKARQFPTLVVWGDNDPIFTTKGRDLFRTLTPSAEVHSYQAGHFALETHAPEIATAMLAFLDRLPEAAAH